MRIRETLASLLSLLGYVGIVGVVVCVTGTEDVRAQSADEHPLSIPPSTRPVRKITIGQYTFELPDGWELRDDKKTVMLVPPGSKEENAPAAIVIYPPFVAKNVTVEEWFKQFAAKVHKDFTEKQKGEAKTQDTGGGKMLVQFFVLELKGEPQYRLYAVAKAGDTAQVIMFSSFSGDVFKRYLPAMTKLIASAQRADAAAAP